MSLERARAAFEALVARLLARLPFHAKWPGRVVSQGVDGSLEVLLDTDVVPGEVGAKLRTAIPGMVIKVPAGTRVQVAYEGGDPRAPVAELFESGTPSEVTITVSGPFKVSTGGHEATEHVLTTEAIVNILTALGEALTPPLSPPQIAGVIAAASVMGPPFSPEMQAALDAAFALPKPGVGCKEFLCG